MSRKHLIVDDSEINRMILKIFLTNHGIQSDEVEDGEEVMEKIINSTYSAIWMDLNMDRMDGFECLKQIKTTFSGKIYAVTGYCDDHTIYMCDDAGFDGIITKPFTGDDIAKYVYHN